MSGKTCHIWPKSPKENGGEIKVSFLVEPHREKAFEIWFKIPEELKSAVSERSDAFLTAAMFHLMSRNENAKVHGPITSSLLFGLHNYMSIWHRWNRDLYHVVDLDCEAEVTSPEADGDEAIALYSGGVDASFTALRHARKSAGRFSRNLTTCLMVHGFNISLDDQEHFEQAFGLARESLETLSLFHSCRCKPIGGTTRQAPSKTRTRVAWRPFYHSFKNGSESACSEAPAPTTILIRGVLIQPVTYSFQVTPLK